jgi:rod shape-determining protein MreD
MKRGALLLVVGVLALLFQGAVAAEIPARFVPDLGLLMVVAFGVSLRSGVGGVTLAALLGFVTDLLSGSLLGQHALLRMAALAATRLFSGRLNLRGPLPQLIFVTALSVGDAFALWALAAFFSPEALPGPGIRNGLLAHALINGLCAPFVIAATGRLLNLAGREEAGQRLMRLEPRDWTA